MSSKKHVYNIVAFGDSITFGAKATGYEHSWLGVFEEQLRLFVADDITLKNRSVGDNVISPASTNYDISIKPSAKERLQYDVIAENPDLVFVCFGLNDMRFGTPVDVFIKELSDMVETIIEKLPKTSVMLTNVFHMTGFELYPPRNKGSLQMMREYNQAIAKYAERISLPLADTAIAMAENDALIHDDGVHGNDLGHRIIGNRVFEAFVAAASSAKTRHFDTSKLTFKSFLRDEKYCL